MQIDKTEFKISAPVSSTVHIRVGAKIVGYLEMDTNLWNGALWRGYYSGAYATENNLTLECVATGLNLEQCLENFIEAYEYDER